MSRRRVPLAILVPLALLMSLMIAAPVAAVETVLVAEMSGDQEVPGPGDPEGFGFAEVRIDPDAGTVCWLMHWEEIAEPTAAHIHEGAEDVAGPPVVTFEAPFEENCVEGQDGATLQAIVDDPAGYYVNIHNADYPDGAVRGQLFVPPVTLFAQLSGENEVPGPGDPDAAGDAFLDLFVEDGRVCVGIFVTGAEDFSAAHIHVGGEGEAGPPVVTLPTPNEEGVAEGCVEGVDSSLLQEIVDDPAGYYVNIHTTEYPDGAVRGQLSTEPPEPPPPQDCEPPEICDGTMPPGDYVYDEFDETLSFTTDDTGRGRLLSDGFGLESDEINGALYTFSFSGEVGGGECGNQPEQLEDSAESLAGWLADHPALQVGEVEEVSLGGRPALRVDARADLPEECFDGEFSQYVLIFSPPSDTFWVAHGERLRFILQDIGDQTIITVVDDFDGEDFGDTLARYRSELQSMVWGSAQGPGDDDDDGDGGGLPDTAIFVAPMEVLGLVLIGAALVTALARRWSVRRDL